MKSLSTHLPELLELQALIESHHETLRPRTLETIEFQNETFPIYALEMGSKKPDAPSFVLTGGVHGLERIGTRVILSYLKTLLTYAKWDRTLESFLSNVRLTFIPMINPVGMFLNQRANGRGVDLMRNSPVEADQTQTKFLIAGHRISSKIPWYRGEIGQGMEVESIATTEYIQSFIKESKVSILLDVHSGFGITDRLWFPYAKSKMPFPNITEMYNLNSLLNETLPNHIYQVEPQSIVYTTHGDLWDYVYDKHRALNPNAVFIPLTLELGSWLWIKKNPKQLFSALGIFNPMIPHRQKRILRRHVGLIDFLIRAAGSPESWTTIQSDRDLAIQFWYKAA